MVWEGGGCEVVGWEAGVWAATGRAADWAQAKVGMGMAAGATGGARGLRASPGAWASQTACQGWMDACCHMPWVRARHLT